MYKTVVIKGDELTSKNPYVSSYITNLNNFYKQNPNIEIINIKHLVTSMADYTAIITYKEGKNK